MSLSSSTLNLKFMQRAAARNSTSGTSTPSRPTPPPGVLTPGQSPAPDHKPSSGLREVVSAPSPRDSPAANAPVPVLVGLAAEQEAKARWVLPKRVRPTENGGGVKVEEGMEVDERGEGRVTFESSYLPFIFAGEEGEAGPSRPGRFSGGGGRMAFGGFGEAPKVEEAEEEEGEEEDAQAGRKGKGRPDEGKRQDVRKAGGMFKAVEQSRDRPKARRDGGPESGAHGVKQDTKPQIPPPPPHTTSQGFVRPANYTSDLPRPAPTQSSTSSSSRPKATSQADNKPSTAEGPKHKRKPSTAPDSLRPSASTSTSTASSSPNPSAKAGKKRTKSTASAGQAPAVKVEGAKRAKLDLSSSSTPVVDLAGAGADLDARERAIKAEKKREKKAKRKVKAEA